MWTLHEIQNQFNPDESFTLTTLYGRLYRNRNIIHVGKTAEDDYHCEKCENNELLLTALKKKLQHFAEMVKIDPASFMESLICSIKNYDCCRGNCMSGVDLKEYQELIDYIKTLEEIQHCQCVGK